MVFGKSIINKFCIEDIQYDCIIQIRITGNDHILLDRLMKNIDFDIEQDKYDFFGTLPNPNTKTLDRIIYVKKKMI